MNSKPLSEQLEEAFIRCRDMDASLAERLQAFAEAVRSFGPIFQSSVDDLVARLREHDVGENAPKPGEMMPPFMLPDETGQMITLEKLLEAGPVAVTFHRGHWCPYCRINTRALAQAQAAVRRHQLLLELRLPAGLHVLLLARGQRPALEGDARRAHARRSATAAGALGFRRRALL